jgi:hypothetical protein
MYYEFAASARLLRTYYLVTRCGNSRRHREVVRRPWLPVTTQIQAASGDRYLAAGSCDARGVPVSVVAGWTGSSIGGRGR